DELALDLAQEVANVLREVEHVGGYVELVLGGDVCGIGLQPDCHAADTTSDARRLAAIAPVPPGRLAGARLRVLLCRSAARRADPAVQPRGAQRSSRPDRQES